MNKWKYSYRRWTLVANPCVTISLTKDKQYRLSWASPTEHDSITYGNLALAKAKGEGWASRKQVSPFA